MGPTIEEVEHAIGEILGPGTETHLYLDGGRVMGFVAHPTFRTLDVPERTQLVRAALHGKFGDRESGIGILLLYSPEEYRQIAS